MRSYSFLFVVVVACSLCATTFAASGETEDWRISRPSDGWPEDEFFAIVLRHFDGFVCGRANVSGMGTNRLDRSLVLGHEKAKSIEIQYTSSYESKGVAKAILTKRGNQLIWEPIDERLGWFWGKTVFNRTKKVASSLQPEEVRRCHAAKLKLDAGTLVAEDLYVSP